MSDKGLVGLATKVSVHFEHTLRKVATESGHGEAEVRLLLSCTPELAALVEAARRLGRPIDPTGRCALCGGETFAHRGKCPTGRILRVIDALDQKAAGQVLSVPSGRPAATESGPPTP
jgi:hypothetical protein